MVCPALVHRLVGLLYRTGDAGDYASRSSQGLGDAQPLCEFRAVGLFQILQLPGGDHHSTAGWRMGEVGYILASRYLFFYFPEPELRD